MVFVGRKLSLFVLSLLVMMIFQGVSSTSSYAMNCTSLLEEIKNPDQTIKGSDVLYSLVFDSKLFSSQLFIETVKKVTSQFPRDTPKFKFMTPDQQNKYITNVYTNLRSKFPAGRDNLKTFTETNPSILIELSGIYAKDKITQQEAAEYHDAFEVIEKNPEYKKVIFEYLGFALSEESKISSAKHRRRAVEAILAKDAQVVVSIDTVTSIEDLSDGKVRIHRTTPTGTTFSEEADAKDLLMYEYPLLFSQAFFSSLGREVLADKDDQFLENLKKSEDFVREALSQNIWKEVVADYKHQVEATPISGGMGLDRAFKSVVLSLGQSRNLENTARALIFKNLDRVVETGLKFKKLEVKLYQAQRNKNLDKNNFSNNACWTGAATAGLGVAIPIGIAMFRAHAPVPADMLFPLVPGFVGFLGGGLVSGTVAETKPILNAARNIKTKWTNWRTNRLHRKIAKLAEDTKSAAKTTSVSTSESEE